MAKKSAEIMKMNKLNIEAITETIPKNYILKLKTNLINDFSPMFVRINKYRHIDTLPHRHIDTLPHRHGYIISEYKQDSE